MDLDNWSAALAIALHLRDLDELEASGAIDPAISQIQRTQLQIDAGFDTVTFQASRRLAMSMARAFDQDFATLARMTRLRPVDDETYSRLFAVNHPVPATSRQIQLARIPN